MRTRGVSSILILAATLAFGATASAETLRYKWRDAEGNLHYSDSLPSNAGVLGYDVVNSQGILVKRVAPAMSPEQRQAAKEQAKLETQRQNELEQQRREDQQLLAANPRADKERQYYAGKPGAQPDRLARTCGGA
jgi:hypothetical protein